MLVSRKRKPSGSSIRIAVAVQILVHIQEYYQVILAGKLNLFVNPL